jgi:hypothetical protein
MPPHDWIKIKMDKKESIFSECIKYYIEKDKSRFE